VLKRASLTLHGFPGMRYSAPPEDLITLYSVFSDVE
jgi:hypothetical protein